MTKRLLFLFGLSFFSAFLRAQSADPIGGECLPASAKIDLDINNVRVKLLNAGDMWWNLAQNQYTVPASGTVNSMFVGALWFGGLDDNGQLMTSCMTYRQAGIDFWPGPIDTTQASTADSICNKFDRFWKIDRAEVEAFRQHYNDPSYAIPEAILSWPGNGNTAAGYMHYLAPFFDRNGDSHYDPHDGDYPAFALNGQPDCNYNLLGDQAIWWVFNDKGATHTETGANAFGMEIQAMAFAYRTNDALNDATFYRYKIINRSNGNWNQVWMGQFADVDMGAYDDDYVGCDVARGLAYGYNGDINDGTSALPTYYSYGAHPPAIGIDFVQGPLADANDFIDNDRDSLIDEPGERIKMSMFKYYDGDFSAVGNPETGDHFYKFLKGQWKDGSPQTYGGNAYGGNTPAMFMFPDDSDPYGWGTGGSPQSPWTEATTGNTPFDRRFLSSVGPFTMHPGEVQTVTIAVPWARDTSASGDNFSSLEKLKTTDDYIQQLFDNCFSIPCTNHVPPAFTAEINNSQVTFVAYAADGNYSWNFGDQSGSTQKHPMHIYSANGTYPVCLTVMTSCDTQSYCSDVLIDDMTDDCGPAVQRLEGKGSGEHFLEFSSASVDEIFSSGENRVRFPWYEPIHAPVRITYESIGSLVDGDYRIAFDSVEYSSHWRAWRVGSTDTVYSDSTIAYGGKQIIPQWGIAIRVQQVEQPGSQRNPDRNGYVGASMSFADPSKAWLTGVADRDESNSFNWIRAGSMSGTGWSGCSAAFNDAIFGSTYFDAEENFENFIGGTWGPYRTGAPQLTLGNLCYSSGVVFNHMPTISSTSIDNLSSVNLVITSDRSKWSRCPVIETGPNAAVNQGYASPFHLREHASVDKDGLTVAQGGLSDPANPDAADFIASDGMSWFPGYAYDLGTGERLNIAFGENSSLGMENGSDMLWNPTSSLATPLNEMRWGGMHYIYIFGHNGDALFSSGLLNGELKDIPLYDDGKCAQKILSLASSDMERGEVFRDAMWVNIPVLVSGHTLLETDVTVRLRVAKPFAPYNTSANPVNNDMPLYGFRIDKEHLGCGIYQGAVIAFPNPFGENCTIQFENLYGKSYNLKLYDLRGRLVRYYEDVRSDHILIEGAGLLKATYIWSLETEGEKPVVGRIIRL